MMRGMHDAGARRLPRYARAVRRHGVGMLRPLPPPPRARAVQRRDTRREGFVVTRCPLCHPRRLCAEVTLLLPPTHPPRARCICKDPSAAADAARARVAELKGKGAKGKGAAKGNGAKDDAGAADEADEAAAMVSEAEAKLAKLSKRLAKAEAKGDDDAVAKFAAKIVKVTYQHKPPSAALQAPRLATRRSLGVSSAPRERKAADSTRASLSTVGLGNDRPLAAFRTKRSVPILTTCHSSKENRVARSRSCEDQDDQEEEEGIPRIQ